MADTIGYVHSLESFGLVDGAGVRFVVFLQGCNLRCKFCHNPETWSCKGKNVEEWTAEKLFERIYRYRKYWAKNGGITVSGGEPLLQMDFMIELFEIAKKHNVHTAIDTAGQPFDDSNPEWMDKFKKLMSMTDLVILDLKEMNPEKHKNLTGFDNANILKMARWLSDNRKKMWLRHVLVPGLTDDTTGLEEMHKFISELNTVDRVEILPYHTLGLMKWEELKMKYPLEGVPVPTKEQVEEAQKILHTADYLQ